MAVSQTQTNCVNPQIVLQTFCASEMISDILGQECASIECRIIIDYWNERTKIRYNPIGKP
jgi:AAA+ superfamily predicted ATPase